MKNERVLVTGGAGFTGSNLAEELAGKNEVVIIESLGELERTIVFPVHPRTEKCLQEYGLLERMPGNVRLIKPLGYLENFRKVLTKEGVCAIPLYVIKGRNPFWICLC